MTNGLAQVVNVIVPLLLGFLCAHISLDKSGQNKMSWMITRTPDIYKNISKVPPRGRSNFPSFPNLVLLPWNEIPGPVCMYPFLHLKIHPASDWANT